MNRTTIASNATQLFSENTLESHGEDVSPTAVIALCVLALILIVGVVAATFSVETMGLCGCMLIAVLFFLVYGIMLHRRDQMDYQGLMRITDVDYMTRLESSTSETCKPNYDNGYGSDTGTSSGNTNNKNCVTKTSYTLKLEAVYNLDWGYDWACPADDSSSSRDQPPAAKQCRSRARTCEQTVCHRRTCSAKEHDGALQKSSDCVFQQGVGFDEALAARGGYTPYDPLVGPSKDVDWPSLIAYGDCNTCEVALSVLNGSVASLTTIREVKTAGFVFLGAGGAVLVIALIAAFGRDLLFKLKDNKKPTKKYKSQNRFTYRQHQREPVLPVEEHPVPIELQPTPQPVQEDETVQDESKSSSSFAMVSARYIQILPRNDSSSTSSTSQLAPAKQEELPTSV